MVIIAIDLRNRVPLHRLLTDSRGHLLKVRVPQHPLLTGSRGHLLKVHVPQHPLLTGSQGHLLDLRVPQHHLQPVSPEGIQDLNLDQWDHLHPDQWDHPDQQEHHVLQEAEVEAEDVSCPVLLNRNIGNTHFSYAVILAVSFFKEAHIITCIKRSICGVNNLIIAELNHQIPII